MFAMAFPGLGLKPRTTQEVPMPVGRTSRKGRSDLVPSHTVVEIQGIIFRKGLRLTYRKSPTDESREKKEEEPTGAMTWRAVNALYLKGIWFGSIVIIMRS